MEGGEAVDLRTPVALAERVAVVETKVNGLKEDTVVIRTTIHGINNELTKALAVQVKTAEALIGVQSGQRQHADEMRRLSSILQTLVDAKNVAEGAWWATIRISAAIVASISIISIVVTGLAWFLGHVKFGAGP